MRKSAFIFCILLGVMPLFAQVRLLPIEDVILDVYNQLSETEQPAMEELQNTLISLYEQPLNLNSATADDLAILPFLNDDQIDQILLRAYKYSFSSVEELQLVPGLSEYDIRNLSYFVTAEPPTNTISYPSAKEVFHYAKHEVLTRVDVRHMESYKHDPVYVMGRYHFNFRNRYEAGLTLRREPAAEAKDMQYGGYICLHRIGPFSTLVAGNYQAQFGMGLVTAPNFNTGKNAYVLTMGKNRDGLRKYSSVNGNSYHGIGATASIQLPAAKRAPHSLDLSAWYSLTPTNDSLRQHVIGANLTYHYSQLKVGITALENIYSDTLRYYYEHAAYNQNYFRGIRQAVVGINMRYNWGVADVFAELATAQNKVKWGLAATAGLRVTPIQNLGILLLYRYYSPYYDNTWGAAFSESNRINDENGLYLGIESQNIKHLRLTAYGDIFRFSGIKYGIPYFPSYGYDTRWSAEYNPKETLKVSINVRAKEKAKCGTYSLSARFYYQLRQWTFSTRADFNCYKDSVQLPSFGYALMQDVRYQFPKIPLSIELHTVGFNTQKWNNRIYTYEKDVLYGYSVPALYGRGGRWTVNMRYTIHRLTAYLLVAQTVYGKNWAEQKNTARSKTDIHLLLRLSL